MPSTSHPWQVRPISGFTLLELMLVLVVVAVLATIAYPSYQAQILKSRRADAIALMSEVQQAQERWRSSNAHYTSVIGTGGLGFAGTVSSGGHYTVSTAAGAAPGSGYSVTALARGPQTADAGCQALQMVMAAGSVSYRAGTTAASLGDGTDARRCWNR